QPGRSPATTIWRWRRGGAWASMIHTASRWRACPWRKQHIRSIGNRRGAIPKNKPVAGMWAIPSIFTRRFAQQGGGPVVEEVGAGVEGAMSYSAFVQQKGNRRCVAII